MRKQNGFTIVELLIATSVFSVILLIMASGLLYIGKVYYRTVAQNKVQEASRSIIEDISRTIQFSGMSVSFDPIDPMTKKLCAGNTIFLGHINQQVNASALQSGLTRTDGTCSALTPGGDELVPEGMFLHKLEIREHASSSSWEIELQLVSLPEGEIIPGSDLFDESTGTCKGGPGAEFCATSSLKTTVKKRL